MNRPNTITITPLYVGNLRVEGEEMPIYVHVIDHPQARVLVDTTSPDFLGRLAFSTIDHVAKATIDGQVGWGMFEHAVMGRHDPSGFTGWLDMAP